MRIAVYTSITGRKDDLKERQNFRGADFIAFTDFARSRTGWQIREPCRQFADPNRNAKVHKVLAHKYLPDYDYSLWIDGTVCLVQPVEELVERYLIDADIAFFGHHARDSAYVEAETCIAKKLDRPEVIRAQMNRYRTLGFPEKYPLYAGTVILRRHTPEIERFNELWWSEISRHSRRDQLSLGFVLWTLGISPGTFPGNVYQAPSIVTWTDHRGFKLPRWMRPSRAKTNLYHLKSRVQSGIRSRVLRQHALD